jgi:hypothetical protein
MKARISVTDLSQKPRSILDRVHRRGDSLLIQQVGEALAVLEPVVGATIWTSMTATIRDTPHPDAAIAADLRGVQRNQPGVPTDERPS